jgi:hypothetical protein
LYKQRYLKTLASLLPAGALGISMTLGAAPPAAASEEPGGAQPPRIDKDKVSERLSAIRDAVTELAGPTTEAAKTDGRLAWGNFFVAPGIGFGWPNWNNWHNWSNWGNWFRNW